MQSNDSAGEFKKHHALARRLITVAVTIFLCWFPIGLMGLMMASSGLPIAGEVNVVMAIFLLPLNSAINPFLYTLNMLLQRFRRRKEERFEQLFFLVFMPRMRLKVTVPALATSPRPRLSNCSCDGSATVFRLVSTFHAVFLAMKLLHFPQRARPGS